MNNPQDRRSDGYGRSDPSSEDHFGLSADSYTAQRLKHASPKHVHITSRRYFIGPIPEGWLNSHRKTWYRRAHLSFKHYSSKSATFSADASTARLRRLTGLDGPSVAATHRPSHFNPNTIEEEEEEEEQQERATDTDEDNGQREPTVLAPVNTTENDNAWTQAEGERQDGNDVVQPAADAEPLDIPTAEEGRRVPDTVQDTPSSVQGDASYVTARESLHSVKNSPVASAAQHSDQNTGSGHTQEETMGAKTPTQLSFQHPKNGGDLSRVTSSNDDQCYRDAGSSSTSLLPHERPQSSQSLSARTLRPKSPRHEDLPARDSIESQRLDQRLLTHVSSGLVRFNLDDNLVHKQQRLRSRIDRTQKKISSKRQGRRSINDGQIVKTEKMLVRIEATLQELPDDFSENGSLRIESRAIEKWREFIVVCRESTLEHTPFTLQLYKTRVIPEVQTSQMKRSSAFEIPLNPKTTHVNLFSSLDKTVVLWYREPSKKTTKIYIMRSRSAAHSIEWYTFLRESLGWHRPSVLKVNIPDLNVTLLLPKPFERLEAIRDAMTDQSNGSDMDQAMEEEQAAASRIIESCMSMLRERAEWSDVLRVWSKSEKMGLAWKRYDRLEWVHGANEQKMYGTMAMRTSHELELRPKQHYATTVTPRGRDSSLQEPPPVEGFLVRLTSQKGVHQRLGKMFFKRLYFYTHDHYLCFCRPAKATPPPPPTMNMHSGDNVVPSAKQIVDDSPLMYDVDPFPLHNDEIAWLEGGNEAYLQRRDEKAYAEAQRTLETLTDAEGYLNLCQVAQVRTIVRGSTPTDQNLQNGDGANFHQDVRDSRQEDGNTADLDDDRTFELVLLNGLIVRLQAFNQDTRDEWIRRLTNLVEYWKARREDDMLVQKSVRRHNFERLQIDEEMESILGQFAQKWEVTKALASPQLYNMCGISCCRAIKMAGLLYRKPRRHSTFARCSVLLTNGKLLMFQDSLRRRSGEEVPYIHHERQDALDLRDCYVYSGLLTESDLLYQNQTFDSNHPGSHALPRIFPTDGWTSYDEDTATCFVIWHGLQKSYFRAQEAEMEDVNADPQSRRTRTRTRVRQVSALGKPGRSIVFKTRGRVERDRWVLAIEVEIDRLQQEEGVRVVS